MTNYTTSNNQIDTLFTAKDIATILCCSKPQAFLMMRRGDFPVVRMGKLVRVRRSDLEAYIENQVLPSKCFRVNSPWRNNQLTITNEGRG